MKKKRLIASAVLAVMIITAGILICINRCKVIFNDYSMQYIRYKLKEEQYINLFENHREDFEYVVQIASQWTSDEFAAFFISGGTISCTNVEIDNELSQNKKLYQEFLGHLSNIYATDEFDTMSIDRDYPIFFGLTHPPKDCTGLLAYYKGGSEFLKDDYVIIDEHWALAIWEINDGTKDRVDITTPDN